MARRLHFGREFLKMHGLGNDFVIVDARGAPFNPGPGEIATICDRHRGVGGDQLVVLEPPSDAGATVRMRILNVDGAESESCYNATRCVAWLMLEETAAAEVTLETLGGRIRAEPADGGRVTIHIAGPRDGWQDVPLSRPADTAHLPLAAGPLRDPVGLNFGNPHVVFFVPDRDAIDVPHLAAAIAADPLLPESANVGVADVAGPDRLRLVVWERPGILTRACGSGACAAVVAARRRGLVTGDRITVEMPGGSLDIAVRPDGGLAQTGQIAVAFRGQLPASGALAA